MHELTAGESNEPASGDDLKLVPATRWEWLLVAVISAAAAAPFLDKAFHIDDVLYLRVVEQIGRTPTRPYDGLVLWDAEDGQPSSLFDTNYNPPLWQYVLAASLHAFGGDRAEWKLHLVQSAATCLAAFGVFQLGRRFTSRSLWCTTVIILGPFYLPGQNLMLEPPMIALAVWALEFQCRAWREDAARWSWAAGGLISAAILTKYTAGLLIGVVAFGCLCRRQWKSAAGLVLPVVTVIGWTIYCVAVYGRPHLGGQRFDVTADELPTRLLSVLRIIGAVSVLGPLIAVRLLHRGVWGKVLLGLVAGLAATAAWIDLTTVDHKVAVEFQWDLTPLMKGHYLAFTGHGALIVFGFIVLAVLQSVRGTVKSPTFGGVGFLEFWIVTILVFNVVCVPFNAVRHLLLGLMPLTWWLAGLWPAGGSRLMSLGAWASVLLGFGLAFADKEFAGYYRVLAGKELAQTAASKRQMWFTGSWGFAYYASQAGAYPVVADPERFGMPQYRAADLVINPTLLNWRPFPPAGLPPIRAVEHLQPEALSPLRTIAPGVNYYSTDDYGLPWEFLVQPTDPSEKEAYFELPPLDDVLLYEIL